MKSGHQLKNAASVAVWDSYYGHFSGCCLTMFADRNTSSKALRLVSAQCSDPFRLMQRKYSSLACLYTLLLLCFMSRSLGFHRDLISYPVRKTDIGMLFRTLKCSGKNNGEERWHKLSSSRPWKGRTQSLSVWTKGSGRKSATVFSTPFIWSWRSRFQPVDL